MDSEQIRKLVTAHTAYHLATERGNANGMAVWGDMLADAQDATGIIMHDTAALRRHAKYQAGIAANIRDRIAA